MPLPIVYRELLVPLEGTREARKLAALSRQIKIEQFLLAEIMYNGNREFGSDLDFYLEEQRRDLTIRLAQPGSSAGPLIEWVEAKMCWTDCLARELTKRREAMEYRDHMKVDADKQDHGIGALAAGDVGARLTSLLFAVHHNKPTRRQKYYPEFKNRGRSHTPGDIEKEAARHVRDVIAPWINRDVVEEFSVQLDADCRLHVFAFRAKPDASQRSMP